MKLTTVIFAIFITGCTSMTDDRSFNEIDNNVETEDQILSKQSTTKNKKDHNSHINKDNSLNDRVIEEDIIIRTTSNQNGEPKRKPQKSNGEKNKDLDDTELDDAIDGDAIDKDYKKNKTSASSDKNTNK